MKQILLKRLETIEKELEFSYDLLSRVEHAQILANDPIEKARLAENLKTIETGCDKLIADWFYVRELIKKAETLGS